MSVSTIFLYIGSALFSYLFCSLNPAIILSKLVYKKDIRSEGSGNAGFTNFKRTFGGKLAWLVFLLDISKAIIVEFLAGYIYQLCLGEEYRILGFAVTGLFGIIGHSYPVWYKFKGGKAFLVGVTSLFLLSWKAGLIGLCILCLILFTTHYMSLASIISITAAIPFLVIFGVPLPEVILYSCGAAIIVFRHAGNIKRLIHKEERKFYFSSKNKAEKQS